MVDNSSLPVASGNETFANDDIGGVKYPRPKVNWGPDGTANDVDVASGKPLPVQLRSPTGTDLTGTAGTGSAAVLTVQGNASGTAIPVSMASVPAHAVTNAGTFVTQENGAALTAMQLLDDNMVAPGTAIGSTKNALIGGSVTTAAPTYTTGQISPLSLDTSGALRVSGAGGGTQYTEDVAAATDPVGNMLIAVRKDTLSTSEVSADGDNIALKATNKGKLHVAAELRSGDTVLDVGSGTGGSATLRTFIDPGSQNANGRTSAANSTPVVAANEDKTALVDDAAFTPGTSNVNMAGYQADETSTDSVDEGDAGAARMTLDRKQIVTTQPHTQGGATTIRKIDLDEAPSVVKASRGQLYGFYIVNRTTSARYLRFYNVAAASVTVGTTAALVGPIEIPANASDHTALIINFPYGIEFDTAMSWAVTTGFADNDTGAPGTNDILANAFIK